MQSELTKIQIKILIGLKAIQQTGEQIEIINQSAFLRISGTFEKHLRSEYGDLHRAAYLTLQQEVLK